MDIGINIHTCQGNGPMHVVEFDRYGFAIFDEDHRPEGERCHQYSRLNEDSQLLSQWRKVMSQPDWKSMHGCPSIKIQKLLRQGVPAVVRSDIWTNLLDAATLRASSTFNYKAQLRGVREQLVDLGISEYGGPEAVSFLCELESSGVTPAKGHISLECLRQIMLDLDRSFPTHRMFMNGSSEGIEGRAALFRILATYARYNKDVGYCQGMSYIGGLLLMVMEDEEAAFWGLVSLLERFKYLRGYYDRHMERIQRHVMVFQKLVAHRLPSMTKHMEHLGISSMMYATPWFLSLFTGLPCWETVLSIWDLFMLDGAVVMFRVGLGLLESMRECIQGCDDISTLLPFLLHPPFENVDFLSLMPLVFDVYLEDWEVAQLEAIVMEETGVSTRSRRRLTDQNSRSTSRTETSPPKEKRRRIGLESSPQVMQPTPGSSSLFRRFVNIFTPQEQRDESTVDGMGRRIIKRTGARPLSSVGSSYGQIYTDYPAAERWKNSPLRACNRIDRHPPRTSTPKRRLTRRRSSSRLTETNENDVSGQVLRRSPRLRQAVLRDLNSPCTHKLVGSGAEVQLSFKDFRTSKPLRRTQRNPHKDNPSAVLQPGSISSPVELKSMMCKTQ